MKSRRAFTLIEMLVTVALLVIVLGLMVSLARHVRATSANDLSEKVLRDLDAVMDQYLSPVTFVKPARDRGDGSPADPNSPDGSNDPLVPRELPTLAALIPEDAAFVADERSIQVTARANNKDLVRFLRSLGEPAQAFLNSLPLGTYDDVTLRDAWGTPIVFMRQGHKLVGMSSRGYFFFSAGPDRKFLTRDDNLYSYEGR